MRLKEEAIFENRYDAGRQLVEKLSAYKGKPTVVLAIPNGGVPVGFEVAKALEADFDLIVARKIPLPLNPEAGFGAVADDGTLFLNEDIVRQSKLTQEQIDSQVGLVKAEISRRKLLYRKDMPPVMLSGRTVIIVDDGLASGFTVLATTASLRTRRPKEIIVAVPAASATAVEHLKQKADKVIAAAIGSKPEFAVADYYHNWYDVKDEEVIRCLSEARASRFMNKAKKTEPVENTRPRRLW